MTTQLKNKVTTPKQVTVKAVKTATTPRKTKAIKTGYVINYSPAVINTSDVLKTGLTALPAYGTIKPRNAEPLTLGHFIDRVKPFKMKGKATSNYQSKGNYTGKVYNKPINEGACLTIWQWLDKNPTASKKQLIVALPNINVITCGVQFGHWCKSVGRDSKAA